MVTTENDATQVLRGDSYSLSMILLVACLSSACDLDRGPEQPLVEVPRNFRISSNRTNSVATTAGTTAARAPNLGGGFRASRWGMTRDQTRIALGIQPGEPDWRRSDFARLTGGGTAYCKFDSTGRLFRIEYYPNLLCGDATGIRAIDEALTTRHGPGTSGPIHTDTECGGCIDGPMHFDYSVRVWSDGETRIEYLAETGPCGGHQIPDGRSHNRVVYQSIALGEQVRLAEQQRAQEEAERRQEGMRRRQQELQRQL
jgi:hypothetical protein